MDKFIVTLVAATAMMTSFSLSRAQQQVEPQGRQPYPMMGNRRADGPLPPSDAYSLDPSYDYEVGLEADDSAVLENIRPRNRRPNPGGRDENINQLLASAEDCRSKSRTVPHEKYCDLYYHTTGCDDSQSLLRSCPNGLLYTGSGRPGLIGVCDYPHNVNCNGKEKHNPPISTEHCDWLYGIFGHETSCTRYWTCWNGTATEQFCVGGLLYNEETHACDWPQNVGGCQKHPLCKDDPNGNVPLGKSCNRYWACQGGYPRLQRCPAMLVFDKKSKKCVAPPTEDCDIPATTTSPLTDDDEDDRRGEARPNNGGNRRRLQGGPQGALPQGLPFQLPEGASLLPRPQN